MTHVVNGLNLLPDTGLFEDPEMRIGIDVGGTFTDLIGIDGDGNVTVRKTHTTPADPSEGVVTGIGKLLAAAGATARDAELVVHGTTIGTNALLTRNGVKTGLLTTAGFRDVLEIQKKTAHKLMVAVSLY